jgi:hypothetical protein
MIIIFLYITSLSRGLVREFKWASGIQVLFFLFFFVNTDFMGERIFLVDLSQFASLYKRTNRGQIGFIMVYLLMALFLCVEIARKFEGALVKNIN